MTAAQIAAQLDELSKEYAAGDIGWSNYRPFLTKLFALSTALAHRVALLEK